MTTLEDAQLQAAYRHCRTLNARHGKTFFLATALLPASQRRHVHALYGFARYADDVVDRPDPGSNPNERLQALQDEVSEALDGARAQSQVVRAMIATVRRFDIEPVLITDFLASMRSDLSVRRYRTFADLAAYMWGSASVIGLQLLPIIGVTGDQELARRAASDLGVAFQLTNFLRDVGEDYRRGRIYLPQESLEAAGVPEAALGATVVGPEMRELLKSEISRARKFYASAETGIETLAPTGRDCVRTAAVLYGDILAEIERLDYQILSHRATVPRRRRAVIGGRGYLRAVRSRVSARQ